MIVIGSWGDNLQILLQINLIKECFETSSHDFSDTEKSFADLWKTFDPLLKKMMTGAQISKQIKKHSIFKKERFPLLAVQFENKQMYFIIAEFNKWILTMCVVFLKSSACLFFFFYLIYWMCNLGVKEVYIN